MMFENKFKFVVTYKILSYNKLREKVMIHSTAGGELKNYGYYDIAKVEDSLGKTFFVFSPFEVKVGDYVLVAKDIFEEGMKVRVLRIDKKVHEQNFPIPIKRLKKIIEIL